MANDQDTRVILDRIADLDKKVESFISTQHEICRSSHEKLGDHHGTLFDPRVGVATRLQRVEERQGFIWFGVLAFVAGIGKAIYTLILEKH